jgi:hypothetical protein
LEAAREGGRLPGAQKNSPDERGLVKEETPMIRRREGDLFCSICQSGIAPQRDICAVCDLFVTAARRSLELQPIGGEASTPRCC